QACATGRSPPRGSSTSTRRSVTAVAEVFVTCRPSCSSWPVCAEHSGPAWISGTSPATGDDAARAAPRDREGAAGWVGGGGGAAPGARGGAGRAARRPGGPRAPRALGQPPPPGRAAPVARLEDVSTGRGVAAPGREARPPPSAVVGAAHLATIGPAARGRAAAAGAWPAGARRSGQPARRMITLISSALHARCGVLRALAAALTAK